MDSGLPLACPGGACQGAGAELEMRPVKTRVGFAWLSTAQAHAFGVGGGEGGSAGQRLEAGDQRGEAGPTGRWDRPPLGCPAKAQLSSPSPTLAPASPLGSLPVMWLLCGTLGRGLIAADRCTCSRETSAGDGELGGGTVHSDLPPTMPSFLSCFLPALCLEDQLRGLAKFSLLYFLCLGN